MSNIAFVHSVNVLGGAERMSEALIKGLKDKGHRFSLISPSVGALSETFAAYGVQNHFLSFFQPSISQPFSTWKSNKHICSLLKEARIDLLHTGDLICTRSVIKAAYSLKIPVVCHIHFPLEEPFVAWVFKRLPAPQAFVFCSHELQADTGKLLAKYYPKTPQYMIHNGVNIDYFKPRLATTTEQKNLTHIGIVANLQERKGHEDFIDMAKDVVATHNNVHFDIIGGDILQAPREAILKQRIEALGLTSFFTFHGQLSDVRDAMNSLDIYVCASHQEAFPVSILEAMACQKTIVSTHVNGIPEMLRHEENALLVAPHKPQQIAKAVKRLLDNPLLAAKLSKQAREDVCQNFNLNRYCNLFENVYSNSFNGNHKNL